MLLVRNLARTTVAASMLLVISGCYVEEEVSTQVFTANGDCGEAGSSFSSFEAKLLKLESSGEMTTIGTTEVSDCDDISFEGVRLAESDKIAIDILAGEKIEGKTSPDYSENSHGILYRSEVGSPRKGNDSSTMMVNGLRFFKTFTGGGDDQEPANGIRSCENPPLRKAELVCEAFWYSETYKDGCFKNKALTRNECDMIKSSQGCNVAALSMLGEKAGSCIVYEKTGWLIKRITPVAFGTGVPALWHKLKEAGYATGCNERVCRPVFK